MNGSNRPIKVIHMAPLGAGGISKLTVTIQRLLNPQKVRFDYLVFRKSKRVPGRSSYCFGWKKANYRYREFAQ